MSFETSVKTPPVVENKEIDQDDVAELGIDPNPGTTVKLKFAEDDEIDDKYVEITDDVIPSTRLFKQPLIVPTI